MFRYMNLFARSIGLSMLDIGLILGLNTILSLPANPLAGKQGYFCISCFFYGKYFFFLQDILVIKLVIAWSLFLLWLATLPFLYQCFWFHRILLMQKSGKKKKKKNSAKKSETWFFEKFIMIKSELRINE